MRSFPANPRTTRGLSTLHYVTHYQLLLIMKNIIPRADSLHKIVNFITITRLDGKTFMRLHYKKLEDLANYDPFIISRFQDLRVAQPQEIEELLAPRRERTPEPTSTTEEEASHTQHLHPLESNSHSDSNQSYPSELGESPIPSNPDSYNLTPDAIINGTHTSNDVDAAGVNTQTSTEAAHNDQHGSSLCQESVTLESNATLPDETPPSLELAVGTEPEPTTAVDPLTIPLPSSCDSGLVEENVFSDGDAVDSALESDGLSTSDSIVDDDSQDPSDHEVGEIHASVESEVEVDVIQDSHIEDPSAKPEETSRDTDGDSTPAQHTPITDVSTAQSEPADTSDPSLDQTISAHVDSTPPPQVSDAAGQYSTDIQVGQSHQTHEGIPFSATPLQAENIGLQHDLATRTDNNVPIPINVREPEEANESQNQTNIDRDVDSGLPSPGGPDLPQAVHVVSPSEQPFASPSHAVAPGLDRAVIPEELSRDANDDADVDVETAPTAQSGSVDPSDPSLDQTISAHVDSTSSSLVTDPADQYSTDDQLGDGHQIHEASPSSLTPLAAENIGLQHDLFTNDVAEPELFDDHQEAKGSQNPNIDGDVDSGQPSSVGPDPPQAVHVVSTPESVLPGLDRVIIPEESSMDTNDDADVDAETTSTAQSAPVDPSDPSLNQTISAHVDSAPSPQVSHSAGQYSKVEHGHQIHEGRPPLTALPAENIGLQHDLSTNNNVAEAELFDDLQEATNIDGDVGPAPSSGGRDSLQAVHADSTPEQTSASPSQSVAPGLDQADPVPILGGPRLPNVEENALAVTPNEGMSEGVVGDQPEATDGPLASLLSNLEETESEPLPSLSNPVADNSSETHDESVFNSAIGVHSLEELDPISLGGPAAVTGAPTMNIPIASTPRSPIRVPVEFDVSPSASPSSSNRSVFGDSPTSSRFYSEFHPVPPMSPNMCLSSGNPLLFRPGIFEDSYLTAPIYPVEMPPHSLAEINLPFDLNLQAVNEVSSVDHPFEESSQDSEPASSNVTLIDLWAEADGDAYGTISVTVEPPLLDERGVGTTNLASSMRDSVPDFSLPSGVNEGQTPADDNQVEGLVLSNEAPQETPNEDPSDEPSSETEDAPTPLPKLNIDTSSIPSLMEDSELSAFMSPRDCDTHNVMHAFPRTPSSRQSPLSPASSPRSLYPMFEGSASERRIEKYTKRLCEAREGASARSTFCDVGIQTVSEDQRRLPRLQVDQWTPNNVPSLVSPSIFQRFFPF